MPDKPYEPYTNAMALIEMIDVPDDSDEALRLATVHALLAIARQLQFIHARMVDEMQRGRR
jgi:hypothetical protein